MPTKEQIREKIKNLTLMDDVLFHEAAKDKEFCEEILRVFLDDPNLCVLEEKPQKKLINLEGRSITIDLVCRLGDNTIVNVEVQKNNNVNHKKRVRYHASMLTTNTTDPGQQGNRFYFFLKNIKNNTYIESKKNFYNELENKISKFPESISAKSDSEFLEKFTSLFTPYTLFKLELIREKTSTPNFLILFNTLGPLPFRTLHLSSSYTVSSI